MAALASRNEAAGRHCLVTHPWSTGFQVKLRENFLIRCSPNNDEE